jgi:hypothetical protein
MTHNSRQPIQEDRRKDIKDDKYPYDAKVAPSILKADANGIKEDVCISDLAELALGGRGGIYDRSASIALVGTEVVTTRAGGGYDPDEFGGRTGRRGIGNRHPEDTFNKVGEGRHAVHEDPESREVLGLHQDTVIVSGVTSLTDNTTYPQKIRQRENIKFATLPAVSAWSIPAMMATAKVLVKRKKHSIKSWIVSRVLD